MQNKNYICSKCFKSFDRKSNYARHVNRLTPCIITNKDINIIQNEDLMKYVSKKYPLISEEYLSELIDPDAPIPKKFTCEYCDKSFQNKTYFKKHVSEMCSRNYRFEQQAIGEKLKRIDKFKKENLEIKEKIYYVLKTLPRFYIDDGKVVNVEKNYMNFYELKNLKSFGNEYMDHINDKFLKNMIINPESGIINFIRVVHFNPEIPQNRNIFVKSRKFNFIEVYNKSGWKKIPRKDVFQEIITSKKDLMDEAFERLCEEKELSQKYIVKYEIFSECLDKYINHLCGFAKEFDYRLRKARNVYDRICKAVNLLLLNNTKIEVPYTPETNINTNPELIEEKIKNILSEVEISESDFYNQMSD